MLCKVQNKDENGRSIRHSHYQIELLFKSIHAQGEAASKIWSELPNLLVDQVCLGRDMAWINLFDLPVDSVYIAALFNRPLLANCQQELLALAPPSSSPPTRSDGVSPEERTEAERSHLLMLCHRALFEYDSKYPPLVQPASTSTSGSSTLRPATQCCPAQDMSQLPVEQLTDLAFAPLPSDSGLSGDDVLRFQRLALILQATHVHQNNTW